MIKIAFFDVGETLLHGAELFPGVAAALETIARLETMEAQPLILGVISDYHMPPEPVTEDAILALEAQYRRQVLESTGLDRFFQPFDQKVMISSRAGVRKPDRRIFDAALARMGMAASLAECLFATESSAHLARAKSYGILPVRFGPASQAVLAFDDWADAPGVIAEAVNPGHRGNRVLVAAAALAAQADVVEFVPRTGPRDRLSGRAKRLVPLNDPALGAVQDVFVELPTEATVAFRPNGRVESIEVAPIDEELVADAANYVSSLMQSHKLQVDQSVPAGATHAIEIDDAGRRRLVRRRFSGR